MRNRIRLLLFVLIITLLCWPIVNLMQKEDLKYQVLDARSDELHKTFDNKRDAQEYVDEYKESHDYRIQEISQ